MIPQRQTIAIIAAVLALAYFVILGAAGQREPLLVIRIVNAIVAGALILTYLLKAPTKADLVDRGVLLGLLLFAGAAVLAQFPRQAFDALLGALLFAAAFFVARALLVSDAGRRAFIWCLIGLSSLLTFLTAARWLLPALEWWSLTSWSVIPPLDLNLEAAPWGHRHDLTLLIVMLYPSWWVGRVGPRRAAAATVIGILTLLIVVVDGSRNLWIAMALASAALFIPFAFRHWPKDRRRQVGLGLALAVGVVAVALTGVAGSVLQRLLTAGSIEARFAMWGSLADAWLSKPLAGYGPGSFPWVLQQTSYFDTNAWAPRHPDSVVFQVLPEAGLLGAAALAVVVATLLPAIIRGRSRAASWILITFALAGLGANPTDFGFLVAVAISWAAFAVRRQVRETVQAPAPRRGFGTLASLACFALIAVAWTSTAVADIWYLSARSAIAGARVPEAIPRLELASSLDPGMALYPRQLGTAQLLTDDVRNATQSLEEAVRLNPSDDLAWRVLALAYFVSGESDSARAALEQAVMRQRSDATNLLLTARWQADDGEDEATATLAELVQAWPEVVAAPGWGDLLPPRTSTLDVIEVALERWSRDEPSPVGESLQPLLLAVMAGRGAEVESLAQESLGVALGSAYMAVMGCEPSASAHLDEAPDQARRSSVYWSLVVRQAALDGYDDERAKRLLQIMTDTRLLSASANQALNPLNENGDGGFSADTWGYRRLPIEWPDYASLPSVSAGSARWLLEPREAVLSADLETTLSACR